MKNLVLILGILLASSAQADPLELTPGQLNGDLQFGFQCNYSGKEYMRWSLLTVVSQTIPSKIVYAAFYDFKNGKYLSDWKPVEILNGSMINMVETDYDRVAPVLLELQNAEIQFKLESSSKDISYVFPISYYTKQYKACFIDDTNPDRACAVNAADLPKP